MGLVLEDINVRGLYGLEDKLVSSFKFMVDMVSGASRICELCRQTSIPEKEASGI